MEGLNSWERNNKLIIPDKKTFLNLSRSGKLGNYLRIWDNYKDVYKEKDSFFVTVRSRLIQSSFFIPVVPKQQVTIVAALIEKSIGLNSVYFQEIPNPDIQRTFNLEGMWDNYGLYLTYERETTEPLRGIRERGISAKGLKAHAVMNMLRPSSKEMLENIWENYPTAIIEASEFAFPVGIFQQHMIIWEVRDF